MNENVTDEQIENALAGVGIGSYLAGYKMEVTRKSGEVKIHLERMYEYVLLTFTMLTALAELFGTKNINEDRYSSSGCDTCDYGSCYEINLTIKPEGEK